MTTKKKPAVHAAADEAEATTATAEEGAKARLETMNDRNAKAAGQIATTSAPKKG